MLASCQNPSVIDFKALYTAWQACQKRKAGKTAAQKYEMHLLDNLWHTLQGLQDGSYQATSSYSFVTTQPKLREIHAATFGDRVVHHYLVPRLEEIWEPWFIHDVYSNRKNKGTHKAVKRCQQFMRKDKVKYYLQLDIQNFFYSINQATLLALIEKGLAKAQKQQKLTRPEFAFYLFLCQTFINADFRKTHDLNPHLSQKVPLHKQLAKQPKGQGLPIGNLTSQFFANVYLNELDQFIKRQLKCPYYLRFVDDFMLMSDSPQQLLNWQNKIEYFLYSQLSLRLKAQKTLKPVNQGADFLGYIIRPHYLLVRRRVVGNLKAKLNVFAKQLIQKQNQQTQYYLNPELVEAIRATLASYLGHFKHAHSLKLIQSIWQKYNWLNDLFEFNEKDYQLILKYSPAKTLGFKQQLQFFRDHYPGAKLQVEYGRRTLHFLPDNNLGIKQIIVIKQQGYNHRGIRHRVVRLIKQN